LQRHNVEDSSVVSSSEDRTRHPKPVHSTEASEDQARPLKPVERTDAGVQTIKMVSYTLVNCSIMLTSNNENCYYTRLRVRLIYILLCVYTL